MKPTPIDGHRAQEHLSRPRGPFPKGSQDALIIGHEFELATVTHPLSPNMCARQLWEPIPVELFLLKTLTESPVGDLTMVNGIVGSPRIGREVSTHRLQSLWRSTRHVPMWADTERDSGYPISPERGALPLKRSDPLMDREMPWNGRR